MAAVTDSIHLFFTWALCIYIILDKCFHILYVFGLNSTLCSHIVGVNLSSDQVSYDFMMDAELYNTASFTASAYQKFLATFNLQCVYATIF